MRYINLVQGENIKGGSFTYDLEQRVAIVGPNFSRKTAILETIRLALIGHIPEIGKRPASTWELSSGPRMSAEVHFSDESAIIREFWIDGVTIKERMDTDAGRKPLDWAEEFESLPLLDAERYFGLTDKERTSYVFERVKLPDSYTPESIIAEVERLSLEEQHTEAAEKAKQEFVVQLRKSFLPIPGHADARVPTVQEALADALNDFKAAFSYWNARQKETVGAVRTLTELKNRETQVSAVSEAELAREISAVETEIALLNEEKGAVSSKAMEQERNEAHIVRLQRLLKEDVVDYPRKLAKIQERIDGFQSQLKPVPDKAALDALIIDRDTATKTQAQVQARYDVRKKEIEGFETELSLLNELEACPVCKAAGKGWRANVQRDLNAKLAERRPLQAEDHALLDELNRTITDTNQQLHRISADLDTNSNLRSGIQEAQREYDRTAADQTRAKLTDAERTEELSQRINDRSTENHTSRLRQIETELKAATGKLNDLKAKRQTAVQLQQDLKRAAESQIEHLDAKAHMAVVKAIIKIIEEKRAAMIDEAFGKLIAMANYMVGDILPSPLAFNGGVVGRWTKELVSTSAKFIPHRVFSGVEKTLTYVAIATALSAQAPLRVLILDESARMTNTIRHRMLSRLDAAIESGLIDQAIVVQPTDIPPKDAFPFGWQLISTCFE